MEKRSDFKTVPATEQDMAIINEINNKVRIIFKLKHKDLQPIKVEESYRDYMIEKLYNDEVIGYMKAVWLEKGFNLDIVYLKQLSKGVRISINALIEKGKQHNFDELWICTDIKETVDMLVENGFPTKTEPDEPDRIYYIKSLK